MKLIGRVAVVVSLSLVLSSANASWAMLQDTTDQNNAAPDNTRTNRRDWSNGEHTADQQKENRSDRKLAQQIRRAIVKDKSLSTYAHNVKVVVESGQVTLKGPVRSDEEKKAIENKASEVAGEGKVTSELEVKADK
jgi:hyperosmotically inducible periplasmic protein